MIEVVIKSAQKAGKVLLDGFGKTQAFTYKKDRSILTEFDKKSEKIIISEIKEKYPEHQILSEEVGLNESKSEYLWVIDPLDGTTNFAQGIPLFCVSIGLFVHDQLVLGVIYSPFTDDLYKAELGKGAFLNGKTIHVSGTSNLKDAMVGFSKAHGAKSAQTFYKALNGLAFKTRTIRMYGSAASELAYVACGKTDGRIDINAKLWDYAAGVLIVKEAGGQVTDFEGNEFNKNSKNIISSNGLIHQEMKLAIN